LSRACLGKIIIFINEWRKKTVFRTSSAMTSPLRQRQPRASHNKHRKGN
jgi:hypothetical protein